MPPGFKHCYKCVPPTRYPGCHDQCELYKEDRAEFDRIKGIKTEEHRLELEFIDMARRSLGKKFKGVN